MKNSTIFALVFCLFIASIQANAKPIAGKDYVEINLPVLPSSSSKIELVEIFSYACSDCRDFSPIFDVWKESKKNSIRLRRAPVTYGRPVWESMARLYLALNELGIADEHHQEILDAIHVKKRIIKSKPLYHTDMADLLDVFTTLGIDKEPFTTAWKKSIEAVKGSAKTNLLGDAYGATAIPAIAINGKYLISIDQAGSYEKMLQIADELIQEILTAQARAVIFGPKTNDD